MKEIQGRFPPLYEQFNILRKYEVEVSDDVLEKLDALSPEWHAFDNCIMESEVMLKKYKEKFKTGLVSLQLLLLYTSNCTKL